MDIPLKDLKLSARAGICPWWLINAIFTGIVVLVMVAVMGSRGIRGSIIGQLPGRDKKKKE
jgi:hypothetical protein